MKKFYVLENPDIGDIKTFDNQKDVADFLQTNPSHISSNMAKGWKVKGYTIKKMYENELNDFMDAQHPDNKLKDMLKYDSKGNLIKSIENFATILENHSDFRGKLKFNELTQLESFNGKPLDDSMEIHIRLLFEKITGVRSVDILSDAINTVCRNHSYNPIKDMLNTLPKWDGTPRLEEYFIKMIGADDTSLNRLMTRNFFFGMMKRVFEPGCYWGSILIAQDSTQGTGKSEIMRQITKNFSLDVDVNEVNDNELINRMNQYMVLNFDEMQGWSKQDTTKFKSWITTRSDNVRLKYAKRAQTFPRGCVYFGSTNDNAFLKDYSGGTDVERRFWVMSCHGEKHNQEWWIRNHTTQYKDQILAEALHFYKTNKDYDPNLYDDMQEELRLVQQTRKSFNNDINSQLIIEAALNESFTKEEMKSIYMFKKAVNNILKGDERDWVGNRVLPDKIPVKYINALNPKNKKYNESMVLNMGWKLVEETDGIEKTEYYVRPNIDYRVGEDQGKLF